MKRILLLFLITSTAGSCQDFGELEIIASLPNFMKEVSGIEMVPGSDLLWMVSDSGSKASIYGYNIIEERIEKAISITNGKNKDWEDLTSDHLGNLYIGDFGNNKNHRRNLVIYKVNNISNITSNETQAEITSFYLEDQKKFPPKKKDRNFDIEAFIFLNDNFYLFTRNRSTHFDGITKLYKLPAKAGNFEAKLIGTYKTCDDSKDCQVTSAAIHHETGMIALLSYDKVWLISEYVGDELFKSKIERINLSYSSQKESVTFEDINTLFIADERTGSEGCNLYKLKL